MSARAGVTDLGYPLHWPDGHPRVEKWRRQSGNFKRSLAQARDELLHQLGLLGAKYVVISSNVGGISSKAPEDPGVAVYFDLDQVQHVIPCDKWTRVENNLNALAKTVEAMRGIERWGSGGMMKRAFSAFKALPAKRTWRDVLEVPRDTTLENARTLYLLKAKDAHPDHGGSHERMAELNAAMEQAERELVKEGRP